MDCLKKVIYSLQSHCLREKSYLKLLLLRASKWEVWLNKLGAK